MNANVNVFRRAIYTALIGNYDQLAPINFDSSAEFFVFTDRNDLFAPGWKIKVISDLSDIPSGMPSWMVNRYIKMHPHLLLGDFKETLYVDANIRFLRNPESLFDIYLAASSISIPPHQDRADLRTELDECLSCGKVDAIDYEIMASRINFYQSQGLPRKPMTENNVILRRNSETVAKAMEIWWSEIGKGMIRDQIALPYALYKAGLEVAPLQEGPRTSRNFMTIHPHWPNGKRRNLRYYARLISALRHRSAAHFFCARIVDTIVLLSKKLR